MKKVLVSCSIIILAFMALIVFTQKDLNYPTGKDTFHAFGDGKCQVLSGQSTLLLACKGANNIFNGVVGDVEKYFVDEPNLYIIGYYMSGYGIRGDQKIYDYIDIKSGENKSYEGLSINDIPRYTVLNYETLDVQTYKTLDEVPQEDQAMFNKKVWFGCSNIFVRTCFEKRGEKDSRLE